MAPNLDELLRAKVAEPIDQATISGLLSSPPFVQIDGLFNARDVSDGTHPNLRKGYLFRSGSLENITDRGRDELRSLGIRTIIDLRSAEEVSASPEPDIEGVTFVSAQTKTDTTDFVKFKSVHSIKIKVAESYVDMLETHKDVWRKVLEHLRDFSEGAILVHCTAGRDRTAVAVALVLGIAGLPSSYIRRDYALTRIGIEPVREFLHGKFTGGRSVDFTSERFQTLTRMDPEVMDEFLVQVDDRFGGVEEYVLQVLGFDRSDLEGIRQNLQENERRGSI